MRRRSFALMLLTQCAGRAVIIDRIAVIVGNSVVKDSDIDREIRVTNFLNGEPLDLSAAARKKAASRLIDQVFIRREIRIGDYPPATFQETDQQLGDLKKQRFKTDAAFKQSLQRYGLTEPDLRTQFQWQLTVLRFIDARFKPAVLVSDDEIAVYYGQHPGKASLEDRQDEIRGILTGEKVNQLFFAWLDEQRKEIKIVFREEGLG
jgi:parvulin-like peptidyl-prolyl isomerase